jgi:hypothetical protein
VSAQKLNWYFEQILTLDSCSHYRFQITSSPDYEGKAILRLFNEEKEWGSTFVEAKNQHYPWFDFICSRAGTYNLYITFFGGKEGCAVGILYFVGHNNCN